MDLKKDIEEAHIGPVWFLPGDNRGRYPNCNSVFVDGAGILIDTGANRERLKELRPLVREVWLTHSHEDHILNLDLFEGLPLFTSRPEADVLGDINLFMDAYEIPEHERDFWQPVFEDQFRFKPRRVAGFLEPDATVNAGRTSIRIIGTFGHTPGHLSFFFQGPDVLFMGDYDLTGFGPWYGDKGSSIEGTIESIERLRRVEARAWIVGHESGVLEEQPGSLWDQYLGVIRRREERILSLLAEPRSLGELIDQWVLYGKPKEPKIFYQLGERLHMGKHLARLVKQGRVTSRDGIYRLT